MVQVPAITAFIVTLAAFLYLATSIAQVITWLSNDFVRRYVMRRAMRYSAMIDDLHDAVSKEVDVHFELWWSGEPSRIVRQALKAQVVIPDEAREGLPEGMLDMFRDQFVDVALSEYRNAARHVAVHAVMGAKKGELINMLPNLYGIRAKAMSNQVAHEEGLEEEREQLKSVGINVKKLEANFAHNQ